MLGSPCSPCCDNCTLPAEIPARFSWSLSSASSYRWFQTPDVFGGYSNCQNTATIGMSQTPASIFAGTPYGATELTLTQSSVSSGGTVRGYLYRSTFRLSECCSQVAWNAWVARFPNWQSDNPTWRRLATPQLTLAYEAQLLFYAKEYALLSVAFENAISVIQNRGDILPGTPCGLAEGRAFLDVHAKYENGECQLYKADFQLKGTGSYFGVQYPENPEPWPQNIFSGSDKLKPRFVAYGIQGGRVWLSSDLELQFSADSISREIYPGNYVYVAGANRLALI